MQTFDFEMKELLPVIAMLLLERAACATTPYAPVRVQSEGQPFSALLTPSYDGTNVVIISNSVDARTLRVRASGRGLTRVAGRRSAGHQRGFSRRIAVGPQPVRRRSAADPRPVVHTMSFTNVYTEAEKLQYPGSLYRASTAGLGCYLNSISFIHPDKPVLFIRHKMGFMMGIDLSKGQRIEKLSREMFTYASGKVSRLALDLLASEDPKESRDRLYTLWTTQAR